MNIETIKYYSENRVELEMGYASLIGMNVEQLFNLDDGIVDTESFFKYVDGIINGGKQ